MKNAVKIIVSGLDNAGKTSILTAFDKRYDFDEEVKELQPTRKIQYSHAEFLNKSISYWDMGGQKRYREIYKTNPDSYLADADLLLYVIDVQDRDRFETSLNYLNTILDYFNKNKINIPLIVALHKFDPKLRDDEKIIENVQTLTSKIIQIEQLKRLFIQTSIYDVLSIVQLISTALSLFDEQYLKLKEYFENNLKDLDCISLALYDLKGVIICENYSESLDYDLYLKIVDIIKNHIIQLKKKLDIQSEIDSDVKKIDDVYTSYLQQIQLKKIDFFLSAVIKTSAQIEFLKKISKFAKGLNKILKPML